MVQLHENDIKETYLLPLSDRLLVRKMCLVRVVAATTSLGGYLCQTEW